MSAKSSTFVSAKSARRSDAKPDRKAIPAYAVPYIANDDPTGLSDLEIELIDGFMASTFPRGCSVDWDTCQQPHFSLSPEFGQPCEVYDAVMYGY